MPADRLPQPTVEQIETALDQLLTAIVEHERKRIEAARSRGRGM
jgi:predicted secreted Zn-dependent protease